MKRPDWGYTVVHEQMHWHVGMLEEGGEQLAGHLPYVSMLCWQHCECAAVNLGVQQQICWQDSSCCKCSSYLETIVIIRQARMCLVLC